MLAWHVEPLYKFVSALLRVLVDQARVAVVLGRALVVAAQLLLAAQLLGGRLAEEAAGDRDEDVERRRAPQRLGARRARDQFNRQRTQQKPHSRKPFSPQICTDHKISETEIAEKLSEAKAELAAAKAERAAAAKAAEERYEAGKHAAAHVDAYAATNLLRAQAEKEMQEK